MRFLKITIYLLAITFLYIGLGFFNQAEAALYNCTSVTVTGTYAWSNTAAWANCNGTYPGANYPTDTYNVSIGGGAGAMTFNLDTNNLTIGTLTLAPGNQTLTVNLTGYTLNTAGNVALNAPTGAITSTLSVGTGTLNVTGNITSTGGTTSYISLATVSTGTITVSGNIVLGTNFNRSRFTTTGAATVNAGGTVCVANTTATCTWNAASTLNMTNGSTQLGARTFGIVNINSTTSTVTMQGNATFAGALTIGGSATLDTGTNRTVTLQKAFVKNGTFTAHASPITIGTGTATSNIDGFTTTGLVTYSRTGGTVTMTGNISAGGLTMTGSGGTFNLGAGFTHAFTGTFTRTNGTLNINTSNVTFSGATASSTGTFTASSGTVIFNASGTQTLPVTTYNNVELGGTSAKTMTSITTIGGDLTVSGSATMTGNAAFTVAGAFNYGSSGSTTLTSATAISVGTFNQSAGTLIDNGNTITVTGTGVSTWTESGTFTPTGTVNFNGTAPQIGASNFNNLTITAGGGNTATLTGTADINGALNIASGILDANGQAMTVAGNWTNSGTFTANSNTVTLDGATTQTVSGTLTGTSAFYDLTITNASGADASDDERTGFTAGVDFGSAAKVSNNYTITTASVRVEYESGATYEFANINWNGAAIGTRIFFRNSATSGTWLLKVTGTQTAVSYVNVSRSDASVSGGSQIDALNGNSYDGQNNTNWLLPIPPTEFVSIVDPDNGSGTDYTTLSAWELATQTDLTAATTQVFAGTRNTAPSNGATAYLCTSGNSYRGESARVAHATATQILVDTIAGAVTEASTDYWYSNSSCSAGTKYFTLSDGGNSAIAVASARSSSGTADTTAVTIAGWTTDADHYIKIWTDPSLGNRHNGKWDATKYRLDLNPIGTGSLTSNELYVRIDGIQINSSGSTAYSVPFKSTASGTGDVRLSNSIIKTTSTGNDNGAIDTDTGPSVYRFWNNIIYSSATPNGTATGISSYGAYTVYAYSNTISGFIYGIRSRNSANTIVKNCAVFNNTDDFYNEATLTISYCASDDGDGTNAVDISPGGTESTDWANAFTDYASGDFHVKDSSSVLYGAGVDLSADANLSFSTDIDGAARRSDYDSVTTAADDFNRGSLGSSYTTETDLQALTISSNKLAGTSTYSGAYRNDYADGEDQFSSAALTVVGNPVAVQARTQTGSETSYQFYTDLTGFGSPVGITLVRRNFGSWATLAGGEYTFSVNDVIKITAFGSNPVIVKAYINDVEVLSALDSSASRLSGGYPGWYIGGTTARMDDAKLGNIVGYFWDIGADEAATQIYRSVGPGVSSVLANGATNHLNISGSTATFDTALADNIGVGDALEYDDDNNGTIDASDSIAFITARTSSTVYTIKKADGTAPTIPSAADEIHWNINRAYTSLSDAEAGAESTVIDSDLRNFDTWSGGKDLVTPNEQWNIAVYANGTTADTTADIDGWNTGVQNYIKIYTPTATSEVGTSQRHSGKWDDNKYVITPNFNNSAIYASEEYMIIDGLQIWFNDANSSNAAGIEYGAGGNHSSTISNNIIKGTSDLVSNYSSGIRLEQSGAGNVNIFNNIIYNIQGEYPQESIYSASTSTSSTVYIYNNTIYDSDRCIDFNDSDAEAVLKNNIAQNCTDFNYSGNISASSTNNITDDSSDAAFGVSADSGTTTSASANKLIQTGQNFLTTVQVGMIVKNTTDTTYSYVTAVDSDTQLSLNDNIMATSEAFTIYTNRYGSVSFIDAANDDFHLASTDTAAKNAGVDLSADASLAFSTDIDSAARPPAENSLIAADDFNRTAENPLSKGGAWASAPSRAVMRTSGTQAYGSTAATTNCMNYTGATFSADQYAQAKIVDTNDWKWLNVRNSVSAETKYNLEIQGAGTYARVTRMIAGTATTLATVSASFTSGNTIKFSAEGTGGTVTLKTYVNEVLVNIAYDTDASRIVAAGYPGLCAYQNTTYWDDWKGGNLSFVWDIGADETATPIYRSVGPGVSSVLANGATNALNISGSTATFATALPDNIGVGDALEYDADNNGTIDASDSIAFITSRTSSTVYTIKKADGTVPQIPSAADEIHWNINRAYTSLSDAEAGTESTVIDADLRDFDTWSGGKDILTSNEQWNIAAYANGTTADTTATYINGWTTSAQNYIKVYTPYLTNEVGASQRHAGKWDDTKYKVEGTNSNGIIDAAEDFVWFDGLQVKLTTTTNYTRAVRTSGVGDGGEFKLSNSIVRGSLSGSLTDTWGIVIEWKASGSRTAKIWNNIVYGFTDSGTLAEGMDMNQGWTAYVYNNTFYGNYTGINRNQGSIIAKNNISYNNANNYSGTFIASSSNNLSGPTQTDAPGTSPQNAKIPIFVDEMNRDFHLAPSDTAALDAGANPFLVQQDNFNRANANPIGGDWTGGKNNVQISSNQIKGTTLDDNAAYWNANAFSNDHYSQVKVTYATDGSNHDMGVALRASGSGATFNAYYVWTPGTGIFIDKVINGTLTHISNYDASTTITSGDTLKASIENSGPSQKIYVRKNGIEIGSGFSDSSLQSGGAPGVLIWDLGSNLMTLDDWEGGNLFDAQAVFTDDIDGQTRRQWDIGADEGSVEAVATVMQSGGDYSILSNWETGMQTDLAFSATAVFSGAKTSTVADDAALYLCRSGAYQTITGTAVHATATQALVESISSLTFSFASGDRWYTNNTCNSSGYFTLSNAGNPAIATAKIDGAWTAADTTAVTISGWTTGPNNYVKIYTTTAARHSGKWDDTKYRLARNGDVVSIEEANVVIQGIQIDIAPSSAGTYRSGISAPYSNKDVEVIKISDNIVRQSNVSTNNDGIVVNVDDDIYDSYVWNNIVYGFSGTSNSGIITAGWLWSINDFIYNNTVIDCTVGIYSYNYSILRNNITQNCGDGYPHVIDAVSDYNISNTSQADADSANATFDGYKTVSFVDAANDDFHLSPSDTAAKNAGTNLLADANLPFSQDIDGSYRGYAWDIGADEVATEFVSTVMQSGGNYATLSAWAEKFNANYDGIDLTASTTRLYSGSLTGAITDDTTVTLYRGGVSQGITATAVAKTATQILLKNMSGTTPLNLQANDEWRVDASNLWTVTGTLDSLGASPIAVAKIDGAWTSADTTAVTILYSVITSPDNYMKIYTTSTARHKGVAGSGYRLVVSSNNYPLDDLTGSLRIDGLEIQSTYSGKRVLYIEPNTVAGQYGETQISNNIIHGDGTSTSNGIENANHQGTIKIWNNIIYDVAYEGYESAINNNASATMYVNNNTIGSTIGGTGIRQPVGTIIAKNNLIKSAGESVYQYDGIDSRSDYNACGDANCSGGANDKLSQTFQFVDFANNDFHLAQADTAAQNAGTDLSADANLAFSTDIDSETRPNPDGSIWDIGADEYYPAMQIFRSVGPSATGALATGTGNNLTISGNTATFATAPGDNIGVGDAIQYDSDNNSSTDSLAFITARTDSTHYTVQKADGSDPTAINTAATHIQGNASVDSDTVTLNGITAGNLAVVWVGWDENTASPSVSDGTSSLQAGTIYGQQYGSFAQFFYLLSANGGDKTFTVTWNGSALDKRLFVMEFNASAAWSFDDENGGYDYTTNVYSGTIATANTTEAVIAGYSTYSSYATGSEQINGVSATEPSYSPVTGPSSSVWYRLPTTTFANGQATATIGSTPDWTCNIIAFKVDAGGDQDWSIFRAYTSLANAESGTENTGLNDTVEQFDTSWSAGGGKDLVASNEQWNIAAYANGTTADTTAVAIDGWTTGAQNYIKIYTPVLATEVGTSQRHAGKWDDGKYNLVVSGNTPLRIIEGNVRIDGVQIKYPGTGSSEMDINIYPSEQVDISVANSILTMSGTDTNIYGVRVHTNVTGGSIKVYNNIFYDFSTSTSVAIHTLDMESVLYAYNNTINNCSTGISTNENDQIVAKNNIISSSTTAASGTFAAGTGYNATNNASMNYTVTGGAVGDRVSQTFAFIDYTNKDFHLSPSDTAAKNSGVDLSADANLAFSTDIDGQSRLTVGSWDIGADEALGSSSDTPDSAVVSIGSGVNLKPGTNLLGGAGSCDNATYFCSEYSRCGNDLGDGAHLIVMRSDASISKQWKIANTACDTPQCKTNGGQDGDNLVANNNIDFSAYPARDYCKSIGARLPTNSELSCMYTNRTTFGNNFAADTYWSDTEYSEMTARYVYFGDGAADYDGKTSSLYVRCVKGW